MQIEIAVEKKTLFPCLRLAGMAHFAAFLPVTKLQAESWICSGEAAQPGEIHALLDRLCLRESGGGFPKALHSLKRAPIRSIHRQDALAAVATNLSIWSRNKELENVDAHFPTPQSEWGRLLKWLSGSVPAYDLWFQAKDGFGAFRTLDLFQAICNSGFGYPSAVGNLLWRLKELTGPEDRGLPFMEAGLYELIADKEPVNRTIKGFRREVRPQVAGSSPIWPSLATAASSRWRALRQATLPMVALRPWFAAMDVRGTTPEQAALRIDLEPAGEVFEPDSKSASCSNPAQAQNLRPFVMGPDRMRGRCPFCHAPVGDKPFGWPCFDCVEKWEEKTEEGGLKRQVRSPERDHVRPETPARGERRRIPQLYLEVEQRNSARIRTVANSGDSEAGKTTLLCSFSGLANYPDNKSFLHMLFPETWHFHQELSTLFDLHRGGGKVDPAAAMEAMWVDGRLPKRTRRLEEAARQFFHFKDKPGWFRERELMLILADVAGELVKFPDMVQSAEYPHFATTADVIWVVPADRMSVTMLGGFIRRLSGAEAKGGGQLNLRDVNLILAISKIDELRFGTPEQKDLLQRIMPTPYKLPQARKQEELKEYLEEMERVHHRIVEWLSAQMPMIFGFLKKFGSYRCCGLSSFGFAPMTMGNLESQQEEGEEEEEYGRLPFCPDPVRAVDPFLWLLKENGLIPL